MELFLAYNGPLASLVEFVSQRLGVASRGISDDAGDREVMVCCDTELIAYRDHDLEDDGIPFSRYDVEIQLIRLSSHAPLAIHESFVAALAEFIAANVAAHFSCEVLVVHNLQTLVSRWAAGGERVRETP